MVGVTQRAIVIILILGLFSGLGVSGSTTGQTTDSPPDTDNTVTRIQLHANGSATWFIQIRTRLETDDEVDQYRRFQDRLRTDNTTLDTFRTQMTNVVRGAANTTGRDMSAGSFSLSTHIQEVPRRWGVVTHQFQWTGFAATEGAALIVGDVFEGGFFLASEDRLVIVPPASHQIVDLEPTPDERDGPAVVWTGREDFADEQPYIRLEPAESGQSGSPGPTDSGAEGGTTGFPFTLPDLQGWVGGVAIVLVAGGLIALARYLRTATKSESAAADPSGSDRGPDSIVTDTDRVRHLLEAHDGQLRQADIDDAVEWSSSKTSRVLSQMEDAGAIEKLRIGRENIIRLSNAADPRETE